MYSRPYSRKFTQFTIDQLNEGDMDGHRPLHLACLVNNHKAVNQLLEINNININVQSDNGDTPFMFAMLKSSLECVELMAKNENVDIFQKTYPPKSDIGGQNTYKNFQLDLNFGLQYRSIEVIGGQIQKSSAL